MKKLFCISALAMLVAVGCATDSDVPSLYLGMSRERLKARFGEPLRIEKGRNGGEDWYYAFSSPPQVQAESYRDPLMYSEGASVSVSSSTGKEERPVHLSSEGYVIEPLPGGRIAR